MDNQKLPVRFSLQGIKTEQFATFEENFTPKKEMGIAVGFEFKLNFALHKVGVFLTLQFEQSQQKFLVLVLSCHFRIEDESWSSLVPIDKPSVILPKDFLSHIAMLTVSTARGVLFVKTEGTFCSTFIVPLINVSEMITQDATFEIKNG